MKSASFKICLSVLALLHFDLPASAETPEGMVLQLLFNLNPTENSPLLTRLSPTENRWRFVSLMDPTKLLDPASPSQDVSTGQVEIIGAKPADGKNTGNICKYKTRLFNEHGAVVRVYDFDFSRVQDYKIVNSPVLPNINPVPVQIITISGGSFYTVNSINLETGEVSHGSGNGWQYVLAPNASMERLLQLYGQFSQTICKRN